MKSPLRAVAALLLALGHLALAGTAGASGNAPVIKVLSNRADLISGGDALVEIEVPPGIDVAQLRMDVHGPDNVGRDVTSQFARRGNGRFIGLVTGFADGKNLLTARIPGGRSARIEITNHPNGGPIFAGPQVQPWPCLPGAIDAQCNRPVRYEWYYNGNKPLADKDNPPSDVQTLTIDGKSVPYIVRLEIGTQDRGEYRIATLYDPSKPWEPWAPQDGWTGKLMNVGGAGCGTKHGETTAPPEVLYGDALSRGYTVFSTALSHNTQNCNLVVQAESLMMAKERIEEQYGPIRFTAARGGSGGSIKQQQAANSYPGIFDGIIPEASFPDSWSTLFEVEDCALLINYFTHPEKWAPGVAWDETLMAAVSGHTSVSVCHTWVTWQNFNQLINPSWNVSCTIPDALRYNATTNPTGRRCALQDYMVSVLGTRPPEAWGPVEQLIGRGFANRPWDNVGVTYGLKALREGRITTAQFVDLNAKIGSHDIDYVWQPQRVAADPGALEVAYRGGLINEGTNMTGPIIDGRSYDTVDLHHVYRSYSMRQRLVNAHGHHDNQQIWMGPIPISAHSVQSYGLLFLAMDQWLSAIDADARDVPYEQKVREDMPASAAEHCTDAIGFALPNQLCPILYPLDASPRIVAGSPFADDVIKCQLQPLLPSVFYPVFFTDAEWARLEQTFPEGVCNYDLPGVGQQPTIGWMTYANGPGGEPMGPAPASELANTPPTAVLSGPHEGKVNESLTFSAAGSSDPESTALTYRFDFGDGTVSPESTDDAAHHAYATAGNYTVTLTVKDADGATGTATQPVTIRNVVVPPGPITAKITADYDPGNNTIPLTVTFSAVGSTGPEGATLDYTFVFGDGTQSDRLLTPTASHTYESAGTYRPYVIVTDRGGNSAMSERLSIVAQIAIVVDPAQQIVAELLSDLTSGLYPLTVNFDASNSKPGSGATITSYDFDFGDGTAHATGTNATARHIYTVAGDYTAIVTVTDSAGGTSQATLPIHVGTPNETVAQLRLLGAAAGTVPFTAVFDGSGSIAASGRTLQTWAFDFDGDGTADLTVNTPTDAANVSFAYLAPGTYFPTLTVTDSSQSTATATAKVLVIEPPPVVAPSGGGGGGALGLGFLVPLMGFALLRRRKA